MLFHYGNCKQDIERLKAEKSILSGQITRLLGEIQEQRGVFDYRVAELEKEIASLKNPNPDAIAKKKKK